MQDSAHGVDRSGQIARWTEVFTVLISNFIIYAIEDR